MSELGGVIHRARRERGLSAHALARALGYSERGASKGARRIQELERQGLEGSEFVGAIADELELDRAEAKRLAEAEKTRKEAWKRRAGQDLELLVACGDQLLERREAIVADPELAACRPECLSFGSTITGQLWMDLGALLTLWAEGTLVVSDESGAVLHIHHFGGSPLSGRYRLYGIDFEARESRAALKPEIPFKDYFLPVRDRAVELIAERKGALGLSLAEVLQSLRKR